VPKTPKGGNVPTNIENSRYVQLEIAELLSTVNLLQQELTVLKQQRQADSETIKQLLIEFEKHRRQCCQPTQDKTYADVLKPTKQSNSQSNTIKISSDSATSSIVFDNEARRFRRIPDSTKTYGGAKPKVPTVSQHTATGAGPSTRAANTSTNQRPAGQPIEVRVSSNRSRDIDTEHYPTSRSGYSHSNTGNSYFTHSQAQSQSSQPSSDTQEPVFESVWSKRTHRYYVGGISAASNRAGLVKFLSDSGVKAVGVRIMSTYSGDLAAKITVNSSQSHLVEDKQFWPHKMYCRRWYSADKWNSLFGDNQSHGNQYSDNVQ